MKDFKELDDDDINQLNYILEGISDEYISTEDDYKYFRNSLRHILEVVLTNEEFNNLYGVKDGTEFKENG